LPGPAAWVPPAAGGQGGAVWRPQVTVIDLGWDAAALTDPQAAPRVWLHPGTPAPCPLLVTQPSRPGLAAAERACEALAAVTDGRVIPVARLVLSGADGWDGLSGAGGQGVAALASSAICLPYDRDVAAGGIGASPAPARLQAAAAALTAGWEANGHGLGSAGADICGAGVQVPGSAGGMRMGGELVWPEVEVDQPGDGTPVSTDRPGEGLESDSAGDAGRDGGAGDRDGGEESPAGHDEPGSSVNSPATPHAAASSRTAGLVDAGAVWDASSTVAAGVAAAGRQAPSGRGVSLVKVAGAAVAAAREASSRLAAAAQHCAAQMPDVAGSAVDWSAFGRIIPVLGTGQSGASVSAMAIAEAAAHAGWRVLLIDQADPATSGLAGGVLLGPAGEGITAGVRVAHTRGDTHRGEGIRVAGLDIDDPVAAPGAVPGPAAWLPPEVAQGGWGPQVTVVDVGWDAARVAACPGIGAGQWLRAGAPMPAPVLVARATRPSLGRAEVVCGRLAPWVAAGDIAGIGQLAVTGVRRWPGGLPAAAGAHVAALTGRAVFLPGDDQLALSGVGEAGLPGRLRRAAAVLLERAVPNPDPDPDRPPDGGNAFPEEMGCDAAGPISVTVDEPGGEVDEPDEEW
jgi:hypothetical protein